MCHVQPCQSSSRPEPSPALRPSLRALLRCLNAATHTFTFTQKRSQGWLIRFNGTFSTNRLSRTFENNKVV